MSKTGLTCMAAVLLTLVLAAAGQGDSKGELCERIGRDETVFVPGLGAERVLLGEKEADALKRLRASDYLVSRSGEEDFFRDVLKVSPGFSLLFDKIIYFTDRGMVLLISNGRVVAVSGFSVNRTTPGGISLSRGTEYFLYSCGNRGLKVYRSGKHRVYLYRQRGVCIGDDNGDDSVDFFAVFTPPKAGHGR